VIPEHVKGQVLSQVYFRLFIFVLPVFFVIAAFSAVFSHRIAGPVHRLEQTLDALIQGADVEHIHVRRHDELHGLVEKINKLIDMIRASKRAGTA
jgi:signal transduction histidine kinase